jgi:hypothetical protein
MARISRQTAAALLEAGVANATPSGGGRRRRQKRRIARVGLTASILLALAALAVHFGS